MVREFVFPIARYSSHVQRRTCFLLHRTTGCQACELASLVGPVSSPLATTLHDFDKFPRDDAISLLARVQLIIPHEAIRARVRVAI